MLGRYRIERELGRGGMGVVYVATDVNTDRLVALKTTTVAGLGSGEKTRNQRRERFVREVRALTQVNHPNVVHVFDAGEVDDPDLGWLLFYTMEYVEGTTLAALVQERGALSGGEAAAVVAQVAGGLGEAHKQGIIHRDVKPANIFLSNDGRALIGDFGIAKIEGSTQITRRDQLVGTPNYLAPEQILGEPVGAFTDVFALGALFYVITQNRPLRQQVDAGALLASANGNDPVARVMAAASLTDELKRVVARALERDPNRRYVDGGAFADALVDHATRVPMLSPEVARPSFLSEGTQDRSSAFLNSGSIPSADDADVDALPDQPFAFGEGVGDGGANSVEAAAMAMLGEVERRATGTFKQPERGGPAAELPVARTESTVMFNIRALEESAPNAPAAPQPKPKSTSTSLPVARTESTQVVKRAAITMEPVTDESDDVDDALDGPTLVADDHALMGGPPSVPEQTAPTATQPPQMLKALKKTNEPSTQQAATLPPSEPAFSKALSAFEGVPRAAKLGLTFVMGSIIGVLAAVAAAPPDVLAARGSDVATLMPVPIRARPAMCPPMTPTPEQQAQAALLLDEARTLKDRGVRPSAVVEKLRMAIAIDASNHELFYLLGRVSDPGAQMDDADECVCQLAPESPDCARVERARGD
jgi:serine/threonine protein kinase